MDTRLTRRQVLGVLGVAALPPLGTAFAAQAPDDLHWLSVEEAGRLLRSRKLSPVELTRRMLERITTVDATLNSYATVMAESAMASATDAEREITAGKYRGPLHGVPIAVKDLCYTRGVRTMGGAFVTRDFIPSEDATVVAKLRAGGAVILGKLNLTEGAMGGYHPEMGIPLNPWNTARWPGVSSSGSGVATAAGLCFASLGSDTGGSIRFPSAANGLVGLKPTYGRVSRHGVLVLSESLDHIGPMARRVTDVAIMFDAIAGHDPRDATSLTTPVTRTVAQIDRGIKGMRIGIDRDYALRGIDAGQATAIEEAVKVLTGLGARIVDVKMPDLTGMVNHWLAICTPEAVAAHKAHYPARSADYGSYFRGVLGLGAGMPPKVIADAKAWQADFTKRFSAVLDSVDAMACPGDATPAWPVSRSLQVGPFLEFSAVWTKVSPRSADFTMPMNLAGTPAICLPSGFSTDGLPYSIQFAGRRLSEPSLCRIAYAYERATAWHTRHPNV